jgi:hypothetical protein
MTDQGRRSGRERPLRDLPGRQLRIIRALPGDSIGFGIHSPPFEGLYKFSNFDRDISNNEGPQFWEHYAFLISGAAARHHARPAAFAFM